ncbi:hypothetical protein FACS1894188_11710 [Clostridia bacterium]|nr:hypothetical protein FACS1894188_11710 [Clostridia bacterium]
MEIICAKTAGFCFGVKRAVDTAFELAKTQRVCTLGELIHNDIVIKRLKEQNIDTIDDLKDANGRTVLIRSHGVPPSVYDELRLGKLCPTRVSRVPTTSAKCG